VLEGGHGSHKWTAQTAVGKHAEFLANVRQNFDNLYMPKYRNT